MSGVALLTLSQVVQATLIDSSVQTGLLKEFLRIWSLPCLVEGLIVWSFGWPVAQEAFRASLAQGG